nr:hypothetical protein Itr_chr11CG18610 [Ipomoea trifida]
MPERHRRRLPLGKMQLSHHRPMLCLEEGSRRNHAAATLRRHSRREVASEGRREIVEADRTSMPPPITRRDDRYCGGSVERERKATVRYRQPPPCAAAVSPRTPVVAVGRCSRLTEERGVPPLPSATCRFFCPRHHRSSVGKLPMAELDSVVATPEKRGTPPQRHRRRLPLGKMQLSHHRPMLCLEEGSRRNHAAATLRRHSRREVASEGRREIVEADRTSMPPPITRRDDRYCGGSVERERKAT